VLSEIMRSLDASLEVATFADPFGGIEYGAAASRGHGAHGLQDAEPRWNRGDPAVRRIFGYEDVPIVCITWSTIAKSATAP